MTNQSPTRPVLRYHGGKWMLAPWIIEHFPGHRIYVEPFGGGGSVLLRKRRAKAEIYNDLSGEIVNLFRVLRESPDQLIQAVRFTPFSRDEYAESFAVSTDSVEQARRTLIRSHMGFGSNALCRAVKSGFRGKGIRAGQTPAVDWKRLPDAIALVVDRMHGVIVENKDAVALIENHDSPDTLFYCDPPYVHSTRSTKMHGNHGYDHEMTDEDHTALSSVLHACEGYTVLSGYPSDLYDSLYSDWHRVDKAALADGARERTEVLWLSPRTWDALHSNRLFS